MRYMKRAVLSFAVLAVLAGCAGSTSVRLPAKPAATPNPQPSVASSPPVSAASSAAAAPAGQGNEPTAAGPFICGTLAGGAATAAQLNDVRVASHPGYDRVTFQFAAVGGGPVSHVPVYTIKRQGSANFDLDPSGLPLHLEGTSGLRIVFQDAGAVDNSGPAPITTYHGSSDLKVGLPVVREVAPAGDFERVLTWAIGLASPGCLRVTELSNPARLAVDVQH